MEPTTYKSFEMNEKIFEKKVCTDGMDVVKHKKMLPECQNVTKQNCVTKWVYDDNKQPASAINLCFSTSSWPLFWPFFFLAWRAKNKGGFTTKIPKILGWSLLSWYLFARFATNWFVCSSQTAFARGGERRIKAKASSKKIKAIFSRIGICHALKNSTTTGKLIRLIKRQFSKWETKDCTLWNDTEFCCNKIQSNSTLCWQPKITSNYHLFEFAKLAS